ncbi:hypothetical protein AB0M45_12045 [Nocardia sp. NPDC051787]|uniref:hypothetical protein n=1 Tax=Nocardia sp. NPDC051787 TaxID=3155415 RepID=UPI003443BCB8
MTEPEKLHHFRGHSPGLQACQFFGAFLFRRLTCFARFVLRRAGVGCLPFQAGSVGRLSGRLFPRVGGFPFLELVGHRKFQRYPFGGRPFNPCTLISSACLPGSLGFFSRLPITFDLLRDIRPAACGPFPEPKHLPEPVGSPACLLHQLRGFRSLLALLRLLLPRFLADTGQFLLLTCFPLQSYRPNLAGNMSGDDPMRELVREVSDQSGDKLLRWFRYCLALDRSQHMLVILILIE